MMACSGCRTDCGQLSLIKANWAEATMAASCTNPRPLALARMLADAHGCDVVITIGRHGMVCANSRSSKRKTFEPVPAAL